jgi:hypothetical protein
MLKLEEIGTLVFVQSLETGKIWIITTNLYLRYQSRKLVIYVFKMVEIPKI